MPAICASKFAYYFFSCIPEWRCLILRINQMKLCRVEVWRRKRIARYPVTTEDGTEGAPRIAGLKGALGSREVAVKTTGETVC